MLKKTVMVFALAGALGAASTANAGSYDIPQKNIEVNLVSASKQVDRPMQVARLTEQEMQDTQGAWIWVPLYYAPAVAGHLWVAYQTSAYMPIYHAGVGIGNFIRR